MTPQLQQAIKLLQLSALDLQQEIQQALDSNPLLELSDENSLPVGDQAVDEGAQIENQQGLNELVQPEGGADGQYDAEVDKQIEKPMGDDLPVDSNWEDTYPTSSTPTTSQASDSDFDPLANKSAYETLSDHLLWQLNLTPMADSDRLIAMAIIDAIDNSGFLTQSTPEICAGLQNQSETADVEEEDVDAVLQRIQDFDPIGVGARDLKECLLLQLMMLPSNTPFVSAAQVLIEQYLDLLGSKDFTTLRRRSKLDDEELAGAMALIRTLNPRPGSAVAQEPADYIVPDVLVKKSDGQWVVELNNDATPEIRINALYEEMATNDPLANGNGSKEALSASQDAKHAAQSYLKENLVEARWFLKSLQTRNETLLRVAAKIVEVQRGFLEYGAEAMKPLILADIAAAVDLHESTISRVTSRKYMMTPRGVFELKYFFSSHVGTSSGGEVSSTAIRALIQKLTAEEDPKKPLSDNKIAAILKEQNIKVARRTVAKYRESLSIPPSNERKQLV